MGRTETEAEPRAHLFALQFPLELIPALADRFPSVDERAYEATGAAARARGYYTRSEFVAVCAWKTVRSRPKVASNSAAAVRSATRRAFAATDEAARVGHLLALEGVGMPTASTLLHYAFPAAYPILDVRALESLGVTGRSQYPISFWIGYVEVCRALATASGVSLRTLDKALWQYSKEQAEARAARRGSAMRAEGLEPPRA